MGGFNHGFARICAVRHQSTHNSSRLAAIFANEVLVLRDQAAPLCPAARTRLFHPSLHIWALAGASRARNRQNLGKVLKILFFL
jgi:hypothetical protein